MTFKFFEADLGLCDGSKKNSVLLRERLLELYEELLPKLKSDQVLRSFVKLAKERNKLSTRSPYVPNYQRRGGGYKGASWVGFADPVKYLDPRVGMQFQYGIGEDDYWYGIWVQGDQATRRTELDLLKLLEGYGNDEIAASINELGERYWVQITRDKEDDPFIDTSADKFTLAQAEEWKVNLGRQRLWIAIDRNLTDDELVAIEDVPSDVIKTTHELLNLYRWLTGVASRRMTEDEAVARMRNGETIKIGEDGMVTTSEREGLASVRVGQSALRRLALEVYGHQCALCDLHSDGLLIASHITRWADDIENRGNPRNVLCLCVSHDKMFEQGILRIHPDFRVEFAEGAERIGRESVMFRAIQQNTRETLRMPSNNPPDPKLLEKVLLMASSE